MVRKPSCRWGTGRREVGIACMSQENAQITRPVQRGEIQLTQPEKDRLHTAAQRRLHVGAQLETPRSPGVARNPGRKQWKTSWSTCSEMCWALSKRTPRFGDAFQTPASSHGGLAVPHCGHHASWSERLGEIGYVGSDRKSADWASCRFLRHTPVDSGGRTGTTCGQGLRLFSRIRLEVMFEKIKVKSLAIFNTAVRSPRKQALPVSSSHSPGPKLVLDGPCAP